MPRERNGPAVFRPLRIAILTISDRRTAADDEPGDTLRARLQTAGHLLADRDLVPADVYRIRALVSGWIARADVEVVVATGGTGITDSDLTPEALRPLLDKEIPGFGEQFRAVSVEERGTAGSLSRAFAGLANRTLVFGVPGSTSACRTAWDRVLAEQLDARAPTCNMVTLLPRLDERLPLPHERSAIASTT